MDLLAGPSSPLTKPARSQKRQVLGELRHGNMGEQRLGRQPALDQRRQGLGLRDAAAPPGAGVSHGRIATSTRNGAGVTSSRSERSSPICTISPQLQGQARSSGAMTCSSRGSSFGRLRGPRGWRGGRFPVRACTAASCSSVAVAIATSLANVARTIGATWLALEGQLHLVGVELLGARPEAGPLQLAHQMLEPVIARAKIGILRLEMLAQLGLGGQRLSQLRLDRGPQIGRQPGQEIGIERVRHAHDLPDTAAKPNETRGPIQLAAAGGSTRCAITRRHSRPSNSASNCARLSHMTPSRTLGQAKLPLSSRL